MTKAPGAALLLVLAATTQLSAAVRDGLMPLEPSEAKYRALLHQKLCLAPFDFGRIIVMPPFQKSEIAVSIYSRRSAAGATEYCATSVEAADNLRDWSDAGRVSQRAKDVKVRRIDAPIPAKTAHLVKAVWTHMLAHTQSPTEPRALDLSYMDATMLEFCLGAQARTRCGDLEWVPTLPKKTHLLSDFAVTLPEYCAARANARPALARKLDTQATALLKLLKD